MTGSWRAILLPAGPITGSRQAFRWIADEAGARDFLFDGFPGAAEFRRTSRSLDPPTDIRRATVEEHDPAQCDTLQRGDGRAPDRAPLAALWLSSRAPVGILPRPPLAGPPAPDGDHGTRDPTEAGLR